MMETLLSPGAESTGAPLAEGRAFRCALSPARTRDPTTPPIVERGRIAMKI
jgi:hypothetical protein